MNEHNRSRHVAIQGAAVAAAAVGVVAIGALAVGACAIGALAIGRLAIGQLVVKRGGFKSLHVEELTVTRLRASEITVTNALELPQETRR
jgi:hypothetical protein